MKPVDLNSEDLYAVKMDQIVEPFDRVPVGATITTEGREWRVLRSLYIGDGLYSLRLGDLNSLIISAEGGVQ